MTCSPRVGQVHAGAAGEDEGQAGDPTEAEQCRVRGRSQGAERGHRPTDKDSSRIHHNCNHPSGGLHGGGIGWPGKFLNKTEKHC